MEESELLMKCCVCQGTVAAASVQDHQLHHTALRRLKYKDGGHGPVTVTNLMKRRRAIVKKLMVKFRQNPEDLDLLRRLDKVNEAFDAIRSELLRGRSVHSCLAPLLATPGGYEGNLRLPEKELAEDVESSGLDASVVAGLPACVAAIGTSESQNIQHRQSMEDRTVVRTGFLHQDFRDDAATAGGENATSSSSSCFVGMFDGHWGATAADACQRHFHRLLRGELDDESARFRDDVIDDERGDDDARRLPHRRVLKSFHRAHKKMDALLSHGIGETSKVRWSGCSTLTCLITDEPEANDNGSTDNGPNLGTRNGRIYVANCGDVMAYVCREKQPHALTRAHNLQDAAERDRVKNAGGHVTGFDGTRQVNGLLPVTRGLGNEGDPTLRDCVISSPHTSTARIDRRTHFVVMATRSLWSLLDAHQVFALVAGTSRTWDERVSRFLMPMTLVYKHNADASDDGDKTGSGEFCQLPSIVETEEEMTDEIEEVVIVKGRPDDDDESDSASTQDEAAALSNAEGHRQRTWSTDDVTWSADDVTARTTSHAAGKRARIAQAISERLVRVALAAGCDENISVTLLLFPPFFH